MHSNKLNTVPVPSFIWINHSFVKIDSVDVNFGPINPTSPTALCVRLNDVNYY